MADEFELKIKALQCYDSEMRPFPYVRSYEAVEVLARLRGRNRVSAQRKR